MSDYLGDRSVASTITFNFDTSVNGVMTDLAGSPVISVYKTGSAAETTTGVTLTAPYDSKTGLAHVVIDTSADGTFYAAGNDFSAVITTGTLGGVSQVGRVVGAFSLASAGPVASVTGAVGSVTGAVGSVTGAVGSVTGNVGGNVVGSVASVTGAVGSVTGAVGSVTGAVGSVTARVTANTDQIAGVAAAATTLSKTIGTVPHGTATTGGSTTSIPTSALTIIGSAISGVVSNQFVGGVVIFDGDTTTAGLRGAKSTITANTASNTPTFTVSPALPATPASGDTFEVS